jgi:hypothetical protein
MTEPLFLTLDEVLALHEDQIARYGLKGHDDHSVGETADLTTLPVQAKRAAVLLSGLARR